MPEERENDPSEMTFLEHLEEMRFVILKTLAFFTVALILVLVFFHYFNSMMLYPLNSAKNILSKWVGRVIINPSCKKAMSSHISTEQKSTLHLEKPFKI